MEVLDKIKKYHDTFGPNFCVFFDSFYKEVHIKHNIFHASRDILQFLFNTIEIIQGFF